MKRLDELDLKILDELNENAGSSIPKLSRKLGVKQSKVYSRVKRLMRKGVIQRMTIEVNEESLGFNVKAFVGVNVESLERDKAVEEIAKISEVVLVSEVTGRFDMLIEVHGRPLRRTPLNRGYKKWYRKDSENWNIRRNHALNRCNNRLSSMDLQLHNAVHKPVRLSFALDTLKHSKSQPP